MNCDYNVFRVHCLTTARGCPYTCSFCADKAMWGGRVRRRSVGNVMKELHLMKDTYKIDLVDFEDGTFTFDPAYVRSICKAMIDEKLDMKWGCMARYDNIDEGLLSLMKEANCAGISSALSRGAIGC